MNKKKVVSIIERLVYWFILIAVFYLLGKDSVDFSLLWHSLKGGDYVYFAVALLLMALNIYLFSKSLVISFRLANVDIHVLKMIKYFLITLTLGIMTPLGSTGSSAYIIKRLKSKFKVPIVNSFLGFLINLFFVNVVFIVIALVGISYLALAHVLTGDEWLAFLLEVGYLILIIVFIVGITYFPTQLIAVIRFVSSRFHFLLRKHGSLDRYVPSIARLHNLMQAVLEKKKLLIKNLWITVFYYLSLLLILYLLAVAFHINISFPYIIIIFTIITAVTIVSPTPQGIGFAEGFTQLVANSLNINPSHSFLLIMSYRLVTLWIPVLTGAVVLQFEKLFKES